MLEQFYWIQNPNEVRLPGSLVTEPQPGLLYCMQLLSLKYKKLQTSAQRPSAPQKPVISHLYVSFII